MKVREHLGMKKIAILLITFLYIGCDRSPTLSDVIVGEWTLEKYEAYLDGNPTTAAGSLDRSITFSERGRCCFNGKTNFSYALSGNTITVSNEKRTIEYKVTYFTEDYLVMYFYVNQYKMVYYLQKF